MQSETSITSATARTCQFSIAIDVGKAARVNVIDLILDGKYKFERYDKDTGYIWVSKVMK